MVRPMKWQRLFLLACFAAVVVLYVAGVALNIIFGPVFGYALLLFPAAYGAFHALGFLRKAVPVWRFEHTHATVPTNLHLDTETGLALVTLLNGDLVSLQVPDEVIDEGPPAVATYVVHELAPEFEREVES